MANGKIKTFFAEKLNLGSSNSMAITTNSKVEDSLTCCICLTMYDSCSHCPKILPCLHTFCSSCIGSLIERSNYKIKCPTCRREAEFAEALNTNLALQDVVDAICDKDKARVFCLKHSGEGCFMACSDCYKPLCKVCLKHLWKSSHRKHSIDGIQEVKALMKQRCTNLLDEKAAKAEAELIKKKNAEALDNDLSTIIGVLNNTIKSWKNDCIAERERKIKKQNNFCSYLATSLVEMLDVTDFDELGNALHDCFKERQLERGANLKTKSDFPLQAKDIDELQKTLNAIVDGWFRIVHFEKKKQNKSCTE